MNILIFTSSLALGGAERVVATLANRWCEQGHRVSVATLAPVELDAYTLDEHVHRIALNLTGTSQGMLSALAANLQRVASIRRVLRREKPDCAISFLTDCNVLLALSRGAHRGCRYIGSERSHPPKHRLSRIWEFLRARVYGRLDAVVAQTVESRNWILQHTTARTVVVIPNPVVWPVPERAPIRDPSSVGRANRQRILAVGRLSREKGFDLLIRAFARLAADFPEWEVVIVGEGIERQALEDLVLAAELRDVVLLVGVVGNVGRWLSEADLFVLPSRYEGFPNALAEAMAAGLATISFDCDTGPRDLIENGRNGQLVAKEDEHALEAALRTLLGDATLRASFATEARHVTERFSLDAIDRLWLKALRPVVDHGVEQA
jgi:glycosyltransferase involved in cell wall biosynthesis